MSYSQTKMPTSPALLPTSRWGRVSLGQGGHLLGAPEERETPSLSLRGISPSAPLLLTLPLFFLSQLLPSGSGLGQTLHAPIRVSPGRCWGWNGLRLSHCPFPEVDLIRGEFFAAPN